MDTPKPAFRRKRLIQQRASWMATTPYLQRRTRPVSVTRVHKDAPNSSIEISGLRQLSNKNASLGTRMVWLIIFIGAMIACICHSADRIAYYFSDPSSVQVFYIQNNTIKLPSVTLCPSLFYNELSLDTDLVRERFRNDPDMRLWESDYYGQVLNRMENGNVTLLEFWNLSKLVLLNISLANFDDAEGSAPIRKESLSITEVYTPVGTCHRVKVNEDRKLFDTRPLILLDLSQQSSNHKVVAVTLPEESAIDAYFYHIKGVPLSSSFEIQYVARITESVFRNTSKNPCGDNEDVSNCLAQCFENIFLRNETRNQCRLPFMVYFNETPWCSTRAEMEEMLAITSEAMFMFTPKKCNCWRKCREIIYAVEYANLKYPKIYGNMWVEINVPYGRITMLVEETAYSGYDLFADLGGCLGLWLGLCFLQVLELGTCGVSKLWLKIFSNIKESKPTYKQGRRFRVVVVRTEGFNGKAVPTVDLPGFRNVVKQESPVFIRVLWLAVSVVTLLLCVYQCAERITYYFSDSSTVNVYYTNNITLPFTSIMVCPNPKDELIPSLLANPTTEKPTRNSYFVAPSFTEEHHQPLPEMPKMTIDDAWNETSLALKYLGHGGAVSEDWISSVVPTVVGNCLNFDPKGTINYRGMAPSQLLYVPTISNNEETKLVILYLSEELALVKYLLKLDGNELYAGRIHTAFRITQVSHRNLKQNPCVEREQRERCLVDCIKEKIALKLPNGHCRLPFMDTSTPACNNTADKTTVLNATLNTIKTFKRNACLCFKACIEFLFNKEYLKIGGFCAEDAELCVQMDFWGKELMVMEEISAYSAFALFSDLGGSIGLFSGICVINLFEIGEFLFSKLFIFLKSRICVKKARKRVGPQLHHRRIIVVEGTVGASTNEWREKITSAYAKPTQNNSRTCNRILWFLIYAGSFCPYMYLSAERIQYYISDPTASTTYYSLNKTITFPLMVYCPNIDRSLYGPQKDEGKFLDYWNMTTFKITWLYIQINQKLVRKNNNTMRDEIIVSTTATASGICVIITPRKPVENNGYGTRVQANFDFGRYTPAWMAVISAEKLPLIKYLIQKDFYFARGTETFGADISLKITELVRQNSRKQPCENSHEVASCLVNCIERKIYEKHDMKCRLPFMLESTIFPLCQSKEQYLEVKKAALDVLENFTEKECICARECKSIIYSVDQLKFETSNSLNQYFDTSIPENSFAVIQEDNAYNFIKLLSDLGGSLGLFFGFGLLQVLEMLEATAMKFKVALT